MNLRKKKTLAAKAIKVGKKRIIFLTPRLEEVKEAITKQNIKDLQKEGAILIKPVKGRKKVIKRKKRGVGKIKKKINKRKTEYATMTRKLRKSVAELKRTKSLNLEQVKDIRNKIRNKFLKNKNHLKENLGGLNK